MLRSPGIFTTNLVHKYHTVPSSIARSAVRNVLIPSSLEPRNLQKSGHKVRFASKKAPAFQDVNVDKFFKTGGFAGWSSREVYVELTETTTLLVSQVAVLSTVLFDRFRNSKSTKYTYDLLKGYCVENWADAHENMPPLVRRRETDFYRKCPKAPSVQTIGKHSEDDLGRAIYRMARNQLEKSAKPKQPIDSPRHMQLACYYFEVAIMLGNTSAAVDLVRATSNGDGKVMLDRGEFTVGDAAAKSLIAESAKKNPSACSWSLLATYMDIDFEASKLRKHSSQNLARAIDILLHAIRGGIALSTPARFYFDRCESPHKYLLAILDYCLQNTIRTSTLSTKTLEALREESLQQLASNHDPEACLILAVRDEDFGSWRFGNLISFARSGDLADAHWLMAIYRWRGAGCIPGPEKHKFSIFLRWIVPPKMGFVAARDALSATFKASQIGLDLRKDRDQIFLLRGLATAALYRYMGDHEGGANLLSEMLVCADNYPSVVTPKIAKELEDHLEDYMSGGPDGRGKWTPEKCMDIVEKLTKPELTIDRLRENPKFAKPSTMS